MDILSDLDNLDYEDKHYKRRKADLEDCLSKTYDKIEKTENALVEAKAKKRSILAEKVCGDNIYKALIFFDKMYELMNEAERREFLTQFIEIEFNKVQEWIIQNNYLLDVDDKVVMSKRLAYLIGEINMIHPFREGNGRAQRVFIEYICKNSKHFDIDFSKTTRNDMILASKESSVLNYAPFEELLFKCLVDI